MSCCNNQKNVKKAIIPVAGLGTRMLPITKAIPKEMLPLVDQPLIQFIINECVVSGINSIVVVTNLSKKSIKNYLDVNFKLVDVLEEQVDYKLLIEVGSTCPCNIMIRYVHQECFGGLGRAILCAYPYVGENPIAIILPDMIINKYYCNLKTDNFAGMLKRFSETGRSQILVQPMKDVTNYGVVDCQDKILKPGDNAQIVRIVEKPTAIDCILSNLAVVGRYVFSDRIWDALKIISVKNDTELQLTNAISILICKEIVEAYCLKGMSYDCGNKLGYMQAFVDYGLQHDVWGEDFKVWLKSIIM